MIGIGLDLSCVIAYKSSAIRAADTKSKPEVGSSRSNTSGLAISSKLILTPHLSSANASRFAADDISYSDTALISKIPNVSNRIFIAFFLFSSVTFSGRHRRAVNKDASNIVRRPGEMSC
jgi:hypothetical protein